VSTHALCQRVSGYWYLTGSSFGKWWCQQLWYTIKTLVPVRFFAQQFWYVCKYGQSSHIQQHHHHQRHRNGRIARRRKGKKALRSTATQVQRVAFVAVWRSTVGGTAAASNTHFLVEQCRFILATRKPKTQQISLLPVHLRSASRC
jgi:hypothetical protein